MALPTYEDVIRHQQAYPLVEHGEGLHEGLVWELGACWLCRKPMMCSRERFPQILRLRAGARVQSIIREPRGEKIDIIEYVVELNIGFVQWDSLASMPWAEGAEWEPVDVHGHPVCRPPASVSCPAGECRLWGARE